MLRRGAVRRFEARYEIPVGREVPGQPLPESLGWRFVAVDLQDRTGTDPGVGVRTIRLGETEREYPSDLRASRSRDPLDPFVHRRSGAVQHSRAADVPVEGREELLQSFGFVAMEDQEGDVGHPIANRPGTLESRRVRPSDARRETGDEIYPRARLAGPASAGRPVHMKIYSERLPLKYLFSDHGVCLGVDTVRCSYLFLVSRDGLRLRRRPVGDKVVENLDYEIPAIVRALRSEAPLSPADRR
jgi:hypothetical protein